MATLNVVFAEIGAQGRNGVQPVYHGDFIAAANVTTSGASAQSAAAARKCVARLTAIGGGMYVVSGGASPVATVGGGMYIPSGGTLDLFVQSGWKVAVIDA